MRKFRTIISLVLGALCSQAANAALVGSSNVTVTRVNAFSQFGGGDLVFTVSSPVAGCDGFWLRPSDPGFQTLSALVMTLYASKLQTQVFAYDNELWPGSATSKLCRVYSFS